TCCAFAASTLCMSFAAKLPSRGSPAMRSSNASIWQSTERNVGADGISPHVVGVVVDVVTGATVDVVGTSDELLDVDELDDVLVLVVGTTLLDEVDVVELVDVLVVGTALLEEVDVVELVVVVVGFGNTS